MLRLPFTLLAALLSIGTWSYINPHDRFTWWLETAPAILAVIVLGLTYRRFRFTNLVYVLIALHCTILLVGGHYTYAEVPLFNMIRDHWDMERNQFDRVGHFVQGFVPAMVIRELLLRTSQLKQGKWLCTIIIFCCLGISASYELIEWITSELTGEAAESFLGTQGDVWDTQKDMSLAGIGAILALLLLSRFHDRQLTKLK